MSRRSLSGRTSPRCLSMIAALSAIAGVLLLAQQSWGEEKEKLTAEEKIEKALKRPTSFEFKETSLKEVAIYLGNMHGINILLDRRALGDEGLDPETPVTFSLTQPVKLRSALNLILSDLDLSYVVENEVLVITTTCAAQERLTTRIYAVTELVGNCDEKLDSLADIFTACIAPESWYEVGGEGSLRPLMFNGKSVLVISQTREVHYDIETFIDQFRAAIKE